MLLASVNGSPRNAVRKSAIHAVTASSWRGKPATRRGFCFAQQEFFYGGFKWTPILHPLVIFSSMK